MPATESSLPPAVALVPVLAALAFAAPAAAAPVGDPVPSTDVGRVRVAALVDAQLTRVTDRDCAGETGCVAQDQYAFTGGEVQVNIVDGLAVAGSLGRARSFVDEADFDSTGLGLAVAVKGAVPLSMSWAVFGQARLDAAWPGDAGPDAEKATRTVGTATVGLSWGDVAGGFAGYAGAQTGLWWDQEVRPLGNAGVALPLGPSGPLSAVAGLSLASDPLGAPWGRAPRAVALIEGRAGQSMGAGLGLGLLF